MIPLPSPVSNLRRETEIVVAPIIGRDRGRIMSHFDGRFLPLDPTELSPLIDALVERVDLDGVGMVLAIPEGGILPAYAFAARTGIRLAVATEAPIAPPEGIEFRVGHAGSDDRVIRVFALSRGDHVIVVEDQVVTGETVLRCIEALRAAGVSCDQVATVLVADDARLRRRLMKADVTLHAAATIASGAGHLVRRSS